jgi:SAM-dependent methyltransferase
MINQKFKESVVCPKCKKILLEEKKKIKCENCGCLYQFINNVPIFLEQANSFHNILYDSRKDSKLKKIYKKITFSHTYKTRKSRNRIVNFLRNHQEKKIIINIGAGNTNYNKKVINIDIEIHPNIDLIADSKLLPFKNESVDIIISQAVLEHTPDSVENIDEMHRVLKKDGLIFCEVPFMQTYHAHPHDYFRFTHSGLRNLFKNFEVQEEGISVGPASAFSLNLRILISTLFSFGNKKIFFIVGILANWITIPFKFLDIILEKNPLSFYSASGIYSIFKK